MSETILWCRIDRPGHEYAELGAHDDGWRLAGVAIFAESERPCRLEYAIDCDRAFVTRRCTVSGRVGGERLRVDVERDADGAWSVNGARAPALDGCVDIDLGFSPSTNLLPIRRLELAVGEAAPVRAAWVRFPGLSLEILEQSYRRLADDRYAYESGGGSFRRELTVDGRGFVVRYPGLWEIEAP